MIAYEILLLTASAAIGYLIGSLPYAYVFSRAAGVNILDVGTGNPGAANVFRSINRWLGILVFFADISKGMIPIFIAILIGVSEEHLGLAGAAAIIGHWRPVLPKLGGGAGLATSLGAMVALTPIAGSIGLGVGLLTLLYLRSSGHSAGVALLVTTIVGYLVFNEWVATSSAIGMGGMVMLRHLAILAQKQWAKRVK